MKKVILDFKRKCQKCKERLSGAIYHKKFFCQRCLKDYKKDIKYKNSERRFLGRSCKK